jgi:hypothetical protein
MLGRLFMFKHYQWEDNADFLVEIAPEVNEVLEATFQDAARVISPAGLKDYLDGAKALCGLGSGNDLVITYLEVMTST